MSRAVWTPVAEEDLDDLLYQIAIADRRPETADRLFYELRGLVDAHAGGQQPELRHPMAPAGWLYFRYKRWLVFYKPHPQGIEVMRLMDGARDLPQNLPKGS